MAKSGRKNKGETESRRRQVWELLLRGTPKGVMAALLKVDPNTITQDVKVIRADHKKYVKEIDIQTEFGDALAKFDHLFNLAISEYSMADKGSDKVSFMGQANSAIDKKLKFMMDTGMIPKAVQEVKGEFTVDGIDIRRATAEELKNKRDAILGRLGMGIGLGKATTPSHEEN